MSYSPQMLRVVAARVRLFSSEKPHLAFFGSLATRLTLVETDRVETFETDGRSIFFNPSFAAGLTNAMIDGVMAHEVLHPAFCHHLRRGGREPERWNIAADMAINPLLTEAGMTLPPNGQFPGAVRLEAGRTAEWYYDRLPDKRSGKNRGGGFGEVRDAPEEGDDGANAPGAAAADWAAAVANANSHAAQRGTLPAGLARLVGDVITPKTSWRDELEEFVTVRSRNDYSWSRPNKRLLPYGLYLPSLDSRDLAEIVLLVDCSGSIGEELLKQFSGHLEAVLAANPCRLHVVYHDTSVHRVDEWTPSDGPLELHPTGGGGTSHRPSFEWIAEHAHDAACVIALTDLYSDVSEIPEQAVPVIWACTTDQVAPWGRTIRLEA